MNTPVPVTNAPCQPFPAKLVVLIEDPSTIEPLTSARTRSFCCGIVASFTGSKDTWTYTRPVMTIRSNELMQL